jgi:hypothetical protein
MHATGITVNLSVADLADARDFYEGSHSRTVKDSTWAGRQPSFSRRPRGRPVSYSRCIFPGRYRVFSF